MKKTLLVAAGMIAGTFMVAEAEMYETRATRLHNPSGIVPVSEEVARIYGNPFMNNLGRRAKKNVAFKEDAVDGVDVNFKLTPSGDGFYKPAYVVAVSGNENIDNEVDADTGEATLSLPEGTYDLMCLFLCDQTAIESLYLPKWAVVMRENVEVKEGMTIEMEAEEACNRISFRQQLPDGSEFLPPEIIGLDDEGWPIWNEDEDSYNVIQMYVTNYLVNDKGGKLAFSLSASYRLTSGETEEWTCDLIVNEISDRWTLLQERTSLGCDLPHYMIMASKGMGEQEVMAKGEEFYHYALPYCHTPMAENISDEDKGNGSVESFVWNGSKISDSLMRSQHNGPDCEYPDRYFYSAADERVSVMLYPYICDGKEDVYGEEIVGYMFGAPFGMKDNKGFNAISGSEFMNIDSGDLLPFMYLPDGSMSPLFPGHAGFSHFSDDMPYAFGNSAPVLTTYSSDAAVWFEMPEARMISVSPLYLGRLGENRLSDNVKVGFEVEFNGEVKLKDYNSDWYQFNFQKLFEPWLDGNGEFGEWAIRFSNHNIMVDGIAGKNEAEIRYNDSNDDPFPPTVRFMQFRDVNNVLTDRFAKGADGVINVAVADYDNIVHENFWYNWNELRPVELKVEYAPYGTDDFAELELAEDPAQFGDTPLGYYYSGSLSAVDKFSANGWFDVRLTVIDEAGNSQTQVVSPAFRIETLSGIESVNSELGVKVEGGRIIAPEGSMIYTSAGQKCGADNCHPGVYVVKTAKGVAKVIVK